MYKLPHELPNDLRLKNLENEKILKSPQNWVLKNLEKEKFFK